jgi:hypothetical protein
MGVEGCAASVGTMHTQQPHGELAHRHAMVPAPPPPVADCRSPILPLLLAAHTGGCSMGVEGCAASVGKTNTAPAPEPGISAGILIACGNRQQVDRWA